MISSDNVDSSGQVSFDAVALHPHDDTPFSLSDSGNPLFETSFLSPDDVLLGRDALQRNIELLEDGSQRLAEVPYYTATFHKKERVNGQMYGPQVTSLKLRHKPFSVYMKWSVGDKGREVLYRDGKNNGKMLVRIGGWKGRLLPALNLDPRGSTAMKKSRYPITNLGVGNLMEILVRTRRLDLERDCGYRAWMKDSQMVKDRDCYQFELEYENPSFSSVYRKTVQYIDKETSIPIFIKNYTWPQFVADVDMDRLDESTMIEFYYYENLNLHANLTTSDFERSNKAYHFNR